MKKSLLTLPAAAEFRPVAFYFLNHYLEEAPLRRQIAEMAAKGFGGVMLHPRDGLKTPYLSDAFAQAIGVAIDEAKKQGLSAWLYDEMHYPSGPAGKLLPLTDPDRTQKSLGLVREKFLAPGEECHWERPDHFTTPGGEVRLTPDKFYAVIETSLVSGKSARYHGKRNFPADRAYLCALAEFSLLDAATLAAPIYSGALNPDGSDQELTDEFIDLTHRFYFERFGAEFGKTIPGIFGDNFCPNFGIVRRSAPWGKNFGRRFRSAVGEPIIDFLPALFCAEIPDAAEKRIVFWQWFGREFLASYYGRIARYSSRHHLLTTGHLCLEDGMAEHVRQIGDYFEVMRTMTLCAVDQLGPVTPGAPLLGKGEGEIEDLTGCIRNTASAALWQHRPRVMCECFGLAAENWKLSLLEMQRISGWLFSLGVNLFVPHGLYYSISAHRKWECTPDHLHNSIRHHYRAWSDWIGKLCELAVGSVPTSSVLVLYPVQSLRAHLELGAAPTPDDRSQLGHGAKADRIQRIFRQVLNLLVAHHIQYEVIDEETLKQLAFDGKFKPEGRPGVMKFDTIILPAMDVVNESTRRFLGNYPGKILFVGGAPQWCFDCRKLNPVKVSGRSVDLAEIPAAVKAAPLLKLAPDGEIIARQFRRDGALFTTVFNASTRAKRVEVEIPGGFWFDPADRTSRPAQSGKLQLEAAQLLVLVEKSGLAAPAEEVKFRTSATLPVAWQWRRLDPNLYRSDRWELNYRGIEKIARTTFNCTAAPKKIRLLWDRDFSANEMAAGRNLYSQVSVNGATVKNFAPGATLDHAIWEAEIAPLVKTGVNTVEIRQNGYLEMFERPVYPLLLAGEFAVKLDKIAQESPLACGDLVGQGLEFYSGRIALDAVVELPPARRIKLTLKSIGMSVECRVNGVSAGFALGNPGEFDLSPWAGKRAEISLVGANLPHNLWESGEEKLPFGFTEEPQIKIME